MIDKSFIFLAGHHRSGTSLLHEIIREHPLVSGFSKTGVKEDEGQLLQSVYPAGKEYGGVGRYIFDKRAYMDENHALATDESAEALMEQWGEYYDPACPHYLEKSPPNLIRTRFLQKLFPNSRFVVILRHPLAVGFATRKWSNTSIKSLIEHTLRGYEIFMDDMPHLNNVYVLRYEDFVKSPGDEIVKVYEFLGLEPIPLRHEVRPNVNEKYFSAWRSNRQSLLNRLRFPVSSRLEGRANRFGYSLRNCTNLGEVSFLGAHDNSPRKDVA